MNRDFRELQMLGRRRRLKRDINFGISGVIQAGILSSLLIRTRRQVVYRNGKKWNGERWRKEWQRKERETRGNKRIGFKKKNIWVIKWKEQGGK